MKVKCGKEVIEIFVLECETVGDLKAKLLSILNFKSIKIIHSGKVLKEDDMSIISIPGGINAKVSAVGSAAGATDTARPKGVNVNERRVIDDLTSDGVNHHRQPSTNSRDSKIRVQTEYRFHGIQPLSGLPEESKAREILESLANDPGVLAVMAKHKWSVGALCELYPEGHVGVSDVCVMGLNENKGQRILLRLRTDDMRGFRKILSIRKVLCHELAHNVHGDHDSNFYVLMRSIERDVEAMNWQKGRGVALDSSSSSGGRFLASNLTSSSPQHEQPQQQVRKLGDGTSNGTAGMSLQQMLPPRVLAGTAAILRLTVEEKEVEDNCGSATPSASPRDQMSTVPSVPTSSPTSSPTHIIATAASFPTVTTTAATTTTITVTASGDMATVAQGMEEDMVVADPATTTSVTASSSIGLPAQDDACNVDMNIATTTSSTTTSSSSSRHSPVVESSNEVDKSAAVQLHALAPPIAESSPAAIQEKSDRLAAFLQKTLDMVDETVSFAMLSDSSAAPIDRLLELRDALQEMIQYAINILNATINISAKQPSSGPTATAAVAAASSSNNDTNNGVAATAHAHVDVVEDLRATLRILEKILCNAKDNQDSKFRTVKKTSAAYTRTIGRMHGAWRVLFAAGFKEEEERASSSSDNNFYEYHNNNNNDQNGSRISVWTLKREDPGLLYLVSSLIGSTNQLFTTAVLESTTHNNDNVSSSSSTGSGGGCNETTNTVRAAGPNEFVTTMEV